MIQATIPEVVAEVANLAATLEDSPLFFRSRQTREGIIAMQQASERFAAAQSSGGRLDAALWLGEAYLLFSASLPDTGHGEGSTLWASAAQIARLLGGPDAWEARVRAEFTAAE